MLSLFRTLFILTFCFSSVGSVMAQEKYQTIIVPMVYSSFGDVINPYQISTSLNKVFADKKIPTTLNNNPSDSNYCKQLQVNLLKLNSMFKCKLKVQLKDCLGRVVWEAEGTGVSKEFEAGYYEAIQVALAQLTEMPTIEGAIAEKKEDVSIIKKEERLIFLGDGYRVRLETISESKKALIILNPEDKSYAGEQQVATLRQQGNGSFYDVSFLMPDESIWMGDAIISSKELVLSLTKDGEQKQIVLKKQ